MAGTREPRTGAAAGEDAIEAALRAGDRALHDKGDLRAGRSWFDTAYRKAERQGDPRAMARAAVGLGGLWVHEHRTAADGEMVRERQRRALRLVEPDHPLALRLRIRLAGEHDYRHGEHTAILALVAEAREADDPVPLAEALSLAHHCVLGPEHASLRLDLARDLIAVASRTRRRGDLLMGLLWQTADLFGAGDPHAPRRLEEVRGLLVRGDHLAARYVVSAIEVMLTIRDGRFAEAETLATACAERGAEAGDIDVTGWFAAQLGTVRWYEGRIGELTPMLAQLVNSPTLSAIDYSGLAVLATAAATAGDRRLATGTLARVRGRHLAELPRSSTWLMSMHGVVEAARLLDDAETSRQACELLAPYAELPVFASLGVTCLGSVRHALGVASLTTGDLDRAVEHLRLAVRDNLALGHWPATVLSRSRLSQALALRDGRRDEVAWRELTLAAEDAAAMNMTLPEGARPILVQGASGGTPRVECRRRGRRWQIEMDGRTAFVDHSVGMLYLATLVANPGYEIPAVDLAAGSWRPSRTGARLAVGDPPEPDAAERDRPIAEPAAGVGGPNGGADGDDERARIAVGKAIRRALIRVREADPAIGEILEAAVHTGRYCGYRPG